MLVDMFGVPLAVGLHVLYADNGVKNGEDCPELNVYRIKEIEEPDVVTGEVLSGEFAGCWFYLLDPVRRVVVIGGNRALYNMADCYNDSTLN